MAEVFRRPQLASELAGRLLQPGVLDEGLHEEAKEEEEKEEPMPRDRQRRGHKNIPQQDNPNTRSTPKTGKPRPMQTIQLLTPGRQTFTSKLVRNPAQPIEKEKDQQNLH